MRLALAALALLSALPARAGEMIGTYDFYLGGVHAAEVSFAATWAGERFESRSELRTTGMLEMFWDGFYRVSAEGKVEGERLVPAAFEADSAFGEDRQKVSVVFEGMKPVAVSAEPAFRPKPWEIDPATQDGVADPLTAALVLLRPAPKAEICNRSVEIFDGRRRTRVTLGAPVETEAGVECPALYERVAGFSPGQMKKWTSWELKVKFRLRADGVAEVWEMTGATGYGQAIVRMRG